MNPDPTQPARIFDARDLRPVRVWLTQAPPGLNVSDDGTDDSVETHYDTPDWRFHRAGLSLSIRRMGNGHQALALPLGDSPLAPAGEMIPADAADPLSACPGQVGERVRSLATGASLERRFQLRSHRQRFRVALDDEVLAGVVLDEIAIPLGGQDEPVRLNRVEVSTTGGRHAELTEWIDSLRASFGLSAAAPSRYTASLLALGLTPPALPDVGPTRPSGGLSVGETAFVVLRKQFAKCLSHDPGTRLGEDIEQLHDMRVASRRMRAAIRLYEAYLPRRLLVLGKELAWLGRALGEVRDLDVQLAQLDTWRDELELPDRAALNALADLYRRQWTAARRRMLRALASRRFVRLVERLTAVLAQGPAASSRIARTPILAAAPDLIGRRYKRVVKPGKAIHRNSPEEPYHRLRIRCKALRYALEFHRTLYGTRAEPLIRRLVALQDLLGEHQDAAVASASLRALVQRHGRRLPPETLFVVGILTERYARRARELRSKYPRAFARMRGRRWKRLRRAMNASRPAPVRSRPPAAAPLTPSAVIDINTDEDDSR